MGEGVKESREDEEERERVMTRPRRTEMGVAKDDDEELEIGEGCELIVELEGIE